MEPKGEKNEVGAIAGIIIVIIVLLIGAVYFVNQRIEKQKEIQAMNAAQTQMASDNPDDIKTDASALDFTDLGAGVDTL